MANDIITDYNELGDEVLETVQKGNTILQHLNMNYADQVFKENPVGILNNSVEVITTGTSTPADIFLTEIVISPYEEGSVKLVLNKIVDKSFSFNVKETTFSPGAVSRAADTAARSMRDRYEIEALAEMFRVATPIVLPNGKLKDQTDFAVLEMFANDRGIAVENSVVLLNSVARSHMTEGTTLFAYSANKEQKFSYGLGANTNFANGNGYITTEFGLNFFLTDKLSDNYKYKSAFRWPDIAASASIVNTGVGTISWFITPEGIPTTAISFPSNVAVNIPVGTILNINGKYLKVLKNGYSQPGTGQADNYDAWVLNNEILSGFGNLVEEEDNNAVVGNLSKAQSQGYNCLIFSNLAVAFAVKAPRAMVADHQIINDPITGMAIRYYADWYGKTKDLTFSFDSVMGVKAFLPLQIGAFQG